MIDYLIKSKKLSENISEIISNSPLKVNYIAEKSGIAEPTLYRKMKVKNFTIDEMLNIIQVIKPEEFEYEMMIQGIENGREDIKAGRTIEAIDMPSLKSRVQNWKKKGVAK